MKIRSRRSLPASWTMISRSPETDREREQAFGGTCCSPAPRQSQGSRQSKAHNRQLPQEEVVHRGNPGGAADQGADAVGGLPRHRHLPVVEANLAPVRDREEDEEKGGGNREAGQRPERRARPVSQIGIVARPHPEHNGRRRLETQRHHVERCRGLREERQPRGDAGQRGPGPMTFGERVSAPGHRDERHHRGLEQRDAIPLHPAVIAGEQRRRDKRRAPAR